MSDARQIQAKLRVLEDLTLWQIAEIIVEMEEERLDHLGKIERLEDDLLAAQSNAYEDS